MFPYSFYKMVHLAGIASTLVAMSALAMHALLGGQKYENPIRRLVIALHGGGLLLVLVGGFGMLARIGFSHGAMFPGWLLVKLALWTLLGGLIALPYRAPRLAKLVLLSLPLIVLTAAGMAVYKPL